MHSLSQSPTTLLEEQSGGVSEVIGRGSELMAAGELGARMVRLARLAATLHMSQAAGLITAVAAAEGART